MNNAEYLRGLAERLMRVPTIHGTDQGDVAELERIAAKLAAIERYSSFYPAILTDYSEGEIVVSFPDFPEALSSGVNFGCAMIAAADALEETVLAYMAVGRPIPDPRPPAEGEVAVPLDPITAAGVSLVRYLADEFYKVRLAAPYHHDDVGKTKDVGEVGIEELEKRGLD